MFHLRSRYHAITDIKASIIIHFIVDAVCLSNVLQQKDRGKYHHQEQSL